MANKPNYLRAFELNELYDWAKEKGYEFPTELKAVSDAHARIVNANNKRAGYVRTMQEANAYLTKRYGENARLFTRETYTQELIALNKTISQQLDKFAPSLDNGINISKTRIKEESYAKDEIALNNGIGASLLPQELRNISKAKLHEYMKQASDDTSSSGEWKNYGFYARLAELILTEQTKDSPSIHISDEGIDNLIDTAHKE